MSNYGAALKITLVFTVKSDIIQFCIIEIVTNYIDISRKMNYNRNRQFGRLAGNIYIYLTKFYIT